MLTCVFSCVFPRVLAVSGIGLCVVRQVAHTVFLEVPLSSLSPVSAPGARWGGDGSSFFPVGL